MTTKYDEAPRVGQVWRSRGADGAEWTVEAAVGSLLVMARPGHAAVPDRSAREEERAAMAASDRRRWARNAERDADRALQHEIAGLVTEALALRGPVPQRRAEDAPGRAGTRQGQRDTGGASWPEAEAWPATPGAAPPQPWDSTWQTGRPWGAAAEVVRYAVAFKASLEPPPGRRDTDRDEEPPTLR